MELRKCENCNRAFFGDQSTRLCPICVVAERGKAVTQQRQLEEAAHQASAAPLAAAR